MLILLASKPLWWSEQTGGRVDLSPILTVWSATALCAVLITLAGTLLSRYGEVIADKLLLYLRGE